MRFLPDASAELISESVFEGVAMKKVLIANEFPGPIPPLDQLAPDEFVRKVGENTE